MSTRPYLPGALYRVRTHTLSLGLGATLVATGPLLAGSPAKEVLPPIAVEEKKEEGCFIDPLWNLAALYEAEDEGAFLQYFGLNGRYHGQYNWLDSNEGDNDDWEHRRSRLGFEAEFAGNVELYTSFNLNLDGGDFFSDVDEAYLAWAPAKVFKLSAGKLKPKITQEYRTSSRKILTFERSQIVNQVVPDKIWGVLISGEGVGNPSTDSKTKKQGLAYELGLFSGAADEDDYALPTSEGGLAAYASLGYDFGKPGKIRADYFYQDGDAGNNLVAAFDNVFSLSYEGRYLDKKLGFVANGIYGEGQSDGRGDVWGIILMPSYLVTDSVEVVGRYTFSDSDSGDGLKLQSRYEDDAEDLVSSRVGQYQSVYGGVNYYLCGHRLKLMAGVEYAHGERSGADNYESVTALAGVRLYFGQD